MAFLERQRFAAPAGTVFCWGELVILDLKKVFLDENERMECTIEPVTADWIMPAAISSFSAVRAGITVTNHAGMVVLEAEVSFDASTMCDRCCRDFNRSFAFRFSHILVSGAPGERDDDYIEAPDYKLDADALIRDDVLLELPSKLLCSESCKGLCPVCGKNLNDGNCSCKRHEPDPRLAALSKLLEE